MRQRCWQEEPCGKTVISEFRDNCRSQEHNHITSSNQTSLEVELAGIRQRLGDELYAELVERNRDDLD